MVLRLSRKDEERKLYEMIERVTELTIKIAEYQSVRRNPSFLCSRLRDPKGISYSPVRPDKFLLEIAVDFVTQPGHEHVDNIRLRIEIVTPHMFYNHHLGQHLAAVAQQIFQEGKFPWLEIDLLTGSHNFTGQQIQRKLPGFQTGRLT